MSKFGKKFNCWSCGAKYYDLNKPSPRCPKCNSDPEADPHKGQMLPPTGPGFTDDFVDEVEEEVDEELVADEDEAEEEVEDPTPPTPDDY